MKRIPSTIKARAEHMTVGIRGIPFMPRERKGPFPDETEIRRQQNEKVTIGIVIFYVGNYRSSANNGRGRYKRRHFVRHLRRL